MTEAELAIVRRAYAKQVLAAAACTDERIENAFAATSREAFLGPGPWTMFRFWRGRYEPTPSADPVYLYTDDVIAISPERHINNGQPSLHVHLLACAALREGDHVVHIGAGVGYFTALMAHLAGPSGRITAIEFEPDLAQRLTANVAERGHIQVIQGDGGTVPFDAADVIYVNAGATHPAPSWLDRLKEGGRLILPLTTNEGFLGRDPSKVHKRGAIFLVTRRGAEFEARWISAVAIYPCQGMRDDACERALVQAFEKDDLHRVTRLRRTDEWADDACWLKAPGWCLTYE